VTDAITPEETPEERKRRLNREWIRAKRSTMTPDERAEQRRAYDSAYRDSHRQQRQAYDRARGKRLRGTE
jgi:hypothetical protein